MATPFSLVTARKDFGDRWIGSPLLNALRIHQLRLLASQLAWRGRHWLHPAARRQVPRELFSEGIAVLPNYCPPEQFASVQLEVTRLAEKSEAASPFVCHGEEGFGPPHPFEGGFDGWDGGTLNRFLEVGNAQKELLPSTHALLTQLDQLGAAACANHFRTRRTSVYQTVCVNTDVDPQTVTHRDTFMPSFKLWYFLQDVPVEAGPFEYLPKSHLLSRRRLIWEQAQAVAAARAGQGDGSFRADKGFVPLSEAGEPRSFPVKANTLIIADVRGFHRRGKAQVGSRRLALYGSYRPKYPLRWF